MTTLRLLPDLEESLRRIPGVRAASVVTGPDARPTEIHVLATPGKAAKQVVRDVQSVALAQHDLDLDHRIVSVVQIGDDDPGLSVVTQGGDDTDDPEPARAGLTSVTVRSTVDETEVAVALTIGGQRFEGAATGPVSPAHRPRLAAEAAVAALADLLGIPAVVDAAQVVPSGRHEVAVAVLTLSVPRLGDHVLSGSAVVRTGVEDAIARAVLSAVNRKLAG